MGGKDERFACRQREKQTNKGMAVKLFSIILGWRSTFSFLCENLEPAVCSVSLQAALAQLRINTALIEKLVRRNGRTTLYQSRDPAAVRLLEGIRLYAFDSMIRLKSWSCTGFRVQFRRRESFFFLAKGKPWCTPMAVKRPIGRCDKQAWSKRCLHQTTLKIQLKVVVLVIVKKHPLFWVLMYS